MSAEGFCHACRADVPADPSQPRPTCSRCGHPLIPATYGRRTQRWIDGAWVPSIPRPHGYVWKDPQDDGKIARTTTVDLRRSCAECGGVFEASTRNRRLYCGDRCKRAVQRRRKREAA